MNRLALRLRVVRVPPISTSTLRTRVAALPASARRQYAASAPKEAEQASAQSGGSRSKDAKEQAETAEVDTGNHPSTDRLAGDGAKGRTGGGDPLSSSKNPPPQPKITNASVPGQGRDKLTKEQQEEVDRHNAEFEKKVSRQASRSPLSVWLFPYSSGMLSTNSTMITANPFPSTIERARRQETRWTKITGRGKEVLTDTDEAPLVLITTPH
jgi:hypothetical protein